MACGTCQWLQAGLDNRLQIVGRRPKISLLLKEGKAAPAKRERDSAKHQEKAQTGVVSSGIGSSEPPSLLAKLAGIPSFKRRGFAVFQFIHAFIDRPYNCLICATVWPKNYKP
jgi:hypothetical protein